MKNLFKTIVALSLLLAGSLLFSQSVAAVWSPWQTELFGHTARVFTDDTNYTIRERKQLTGEPKRKDQAHFTTQRACIKNVRAAA
ncbi:hypothetical protein BLIC30S_03039 [Bacillus licheniformis]